MVKEEVSLGTAADEVQRARMGVSNSLGCLDNEDKPNVASNLVYAFGTSKRDNLADESPGAIIVEPLTRIAIDPSTGVETKSRLGLKEA